MIQLKGFDKFREKLPSYKGHRIIIIPLGAMLVAFLGYVFLLLVDIVARVHGSSSVLFVYIEPILPFFGILILSGISSILLSGVWKKRDEMRERYGALAYQKILPRGLTGIALVVSLITHTLTSVSDLPPTPPLNSLTVELSRSMLSLLGVAYSIDMVIRIILGIIILTIGMLTLMSALMTFGIDYMAIVYLYFPEESNIQQNEIYSVLRHPTYFGILLLGTAAFMFQLSVYSVFTLIMLFVIIRLQIAREERELVERFGQAYIEYRDSIPALHIPLRKMRAFFRFLRGKEAQKTRD